MAHGRFTKTRETIYDKDGKVLNDDSNSFAHDNEFYWILTFADKTVKDDGWYDIGDGHGNSKFEVYRTDIYDITYSENSVTYGKLIKRTLREGFGTEGDAAEKKFDYSINGNTLTLTNTITEDVEEKTGIKGATKAIATSIYKKVN